MSAIDFHIHVIPLEMFRPDARSLFERMMGREFDVEKYREVTRNPSNLIRILENAGVEKAVVVTYTCKEVMGFSEDIVEFASKYCHEYPDVLIPFCCPDLNEGNLAHKIDHMASKYEIRGVKLHPVHQLIYPNAYREEQDGFNELRKLYEKTEDLKIPLMIHTGTSIFPRARIKYGDPIHIDDLAVDFPNLKIIVAHGGRPIWMDTATYLVRRHRNVYLEISSIPPKNLLNYFPNLEKISEKTLFGTDWPGADIKNNIDELLAQKISDKAKKEILRENALKILK